MAVIDTFLKLMLERRAEKLQLAAGRVPTLLREGETIELSMPALPAEMLRRIFGEIAGGSAESLGPSGMFRTGEQVEFGYKVHESAPGWRIDIHPAGDLPPEEELPHTIPAPVKQASDPAPAAARTDLRVTPGQPTPDLLAVIASAMADNASDVFFSSGKPPRIRKNGKIALFQADAPDIESILGFLPDEAARTEFERTGSVDFAARWDFPDGPRRIRVNVFRHMDGVAAALRPIRKNIPSLAELSLPEDLLRISSFPSGLVLVTGASGSGKSTTLAALVDHINHTRARHIITIEDPIEYEHRDIQCLIHQREVGADVDSFAGGLRAALRENPDVILLGELRDLDTISAALTAAETGHLVLATLHSGSASTAVNRIVDVFPGHQQAHVRTQLALSLKAVVAQRLVATRDGSMIPAIEKLVVTPAVANGIREGQDHFMRNAMFTGGDDGMVTLERSLAALVRDRLIDRATAFQHANDIKSLEHMLG